MKRYIRCTKLAIDFNDYNSIFDLIKYPIDDIDESQLLELVDYILENLDNQVLRNSLNLLIKTPNLPATVIDKLKSYPYSTVAENMALFNPDLSDKERTDILIPIINKVLNNSYYYKSFDYRLLFLTYENYTPDEVLEYVILNAPTAVRKLVAKRPNLSQNIINLLKNDKSSIIRRRSVEN